MDSNAPLQAARYHNYLGRSWPSRECNRSITRYLRKSVAYNHKCSEPGRRPSPLRGYYSSSFKHTGACSTSHYSSYLSTLCVSTRIWLQKRSFGVRRRHLKAEFMISENPVSDDELCRASASRKLHSRQRPFASSKIL